MQSGPLQGGNGSRPAKLGRLLMTTDTAGSLWTYTVGLATALGQCGLRVDLAAFGDHPTPTQRAEIDRLPRVELLTSGIRLDDSRPVWSESSPPARWLLSLERELAPDMVHLNHSCFGLLPFRSPRLAAVHSCPVSRWCAVHGSAAPAAWDRFRQALSRSLVTADMVVAPTENLLRTLSSIYELPELRLAILNGRDPRTFRPAATKEPFVLSVGRLGDPARNLEALVEAARELPWKVKVAGTPQGAAGALPETVDLLGHLENGHLADWYGRASIFALPTRYCPSGQSVIEAALAGCAPVLGDTPDLREVWEGAARFVDPDDTAALRDAIRSLIDHPAERLELGARARARALALSPVRQAARYLESYVRLLNHPRSPRTVSDPVEHHHRTGDSYQQISA